MSADDIQNFTIGSIVACKTCYGQVYEGEVQAFDNETNMLVLKCPASNGLKTHANVNILNMKHLTDFVVVRESNAVPGPLKMLNVQELNARARKNVAEKRRLFAALRAGVSLQGQQLFLAISKTIKDIVWQGQDIVVFNTVTIKPPYTLENVTGSADSKALDHIRKIVAKHEKDQPKVASDSEGTQLVEGFTK